MRQFTHIGFIGLLALVACGEDGKDTTSPAGGDDGTPSDDGSTDDPGDGGDGGGDDTPVIDADGDGAPATADCDDGDARVYPGAAELCDGLDNDCDGGIDVDAVDAATWYADADGDGFGDADGARQSCSQPTGWVANSDDCDDGDRDVNPETAWYADADGDGYGDPAATTTACAAPAGTVANADDCDDSDAAASPESAWYADIDGDGFGDPETLARACAAPAGFVADASDCDDTDAATNPHTPRYVDSDGDGYGDPASFTTSCVALLGTVANSLDCDDADATMNPETRWYADADDDGYGDPDTSTAACGQPVGFVADASDCDDKDAAASPETPWYADTDGDGYGDPGARVQQCLVPAGHVADASDCDDSDPAISPETVRYADTDGDGYGDLSAPTVSCAAVAGTVLDATDCDDSAAAVNPTTTWFRDADSDGYGDAAHGMVQCAQPAGYVLAGTDCDDAAPALNPATAWYADTDGDGFGDAGSATVQCAQPAGHVLSGGDCDDADAGTFPGQVELCDSIDQDCDGDVADDDSIDARTWYRDVDTDGWGGATATARTACSQPSGYVSNNGDCIDSDGLAYPDSHWPEVPGDGIDQDCDGLDVCTDLNCDGFADIVFANWRENGSTYATDSYIYHGDAAGFDWYDRTALATTGAFAADVADFDQDGYLDVVTASFLPSDYTTDSTVFWGSASGHDAAASSSLDTTGARAVCTGDFDGDGYPDAAFPAYADNGPTFTVDSMVYYGGASGLGADAVALPTVGAFDCTVADLDQDGYEDLVIISQTEDTTDTAIRFATTSTIYWGDPGGLADTNVTDLSTYGSRRVEATDIDGDGWDDLLVTANKVNVGETSDDDEAITVVFWSTEGAFSDTDATEFIAWAGMDTAVADLDGDGYQDIVVARYTGENSSLSDGSVIYWGSASGWSTADTTTLQTYGAVWVSAEDLDNDSYVDLVFSNYKSATTDTDSFVYYGSASGFSETDRDALPTHGTRRHTLADVNGDGWTDIVFSNFFDATTANRADSSIYYGSESGFSTAAVDEVSTFGARWMPIVVGGN